MIYQKPKLNPFTSLPQPVPPDAPTPDPPVDTSTETVGMVPVSGIGFDEFHHSVFEQALRAVPVNLRRDRSNLRFVVSQETFLQYRAELSAKINPTSIYAGLGSGDLTYGGIRVLSDDEMPDGCVEVYAPRDLQPNRIVMPTFLDAFLTEDND